ncbi:hypothetical protein Shal_2797 [Shewanella halifaxensis HAW-EB4]|uniref:Lipoprotein n=1 Tax=Shewanella halifaxensis (strain HAW-EB4) TaxID=458817 RepID=B0TLX8_SHEHH|nr:hypothetical protein [Shewanella halifaxensis]ABZ77350.1 hypothetical protein Shal_2797 [Shewanella halifaxensis HAW-EB4]
MRFFSKLFLLLSLVVLCACGSDSDSEGGIVPPPPPPVVKKSVTAMDFRRSVTIPDDIAQPMTFNLSNYVSTSMELGENSAAKFSLSKVEVLGNLAGCEITKLDKQMLSFSVTPKRSLSCDYRYTVTNGNEQTSALASILFTSNSAKLNAEALGLELPSGGVLPDISKSLTLGDMLNFNIQDELASEFLPMTNPSFASSTVVVGSGTANVSVDGDFSYRGIEIGLTSVSYSVVDDNKLVFTGIINIDVSGDINTAPETKDEAYSRLVPVEDSVTLDILNFPGVGSLVNDKEGDKVQLVGVQVYDANVSLVNPGDVNNTKFTFSASEKGLYEVKYTVYDHEVDGVSSGFISIETGFVREGILEFSFNGFIKLFGDGALGAVGRNTLIKPFKETLLPYMENNGYYASALKNIGFGNYRIDMTSESGGEGKIVLFTALNALQPIETLIELPATSKVYYGLTYADRIMSYGGIAYEVTLTGNAIAHNQIYGTSNTCYGDFADKFNGLNLSGVEKIESFGPFSAVVYFDDGTARYYSIDCGSTGKFISSDWTRYIDKVSQCWDAPDNGKPHGSFYCLNKDQTPQAFVRVVSPHEIDEKGNIFLKFANFFKNTGKKIVKSTQVTKGIAALTQNGDLYVLFDGKDSNGENYKVKKVATRVNDYQQAANYVTYMHMVEEDDRANTMSENDAISNESRDRYYLEFNGYAQYHQEALPNGQKLDMTIKFGKLSRSERKKVKFYENTANAVALIIDGRLKILTNKGLKEYGGRDHHYNIVGDSANSYGVRTETAGQGLSTFFARGNKNGHEEHWELYSPLEELDSSLTCEKPKHGDVSYPYILTGCTYIDFRMNGAVIPLTDSGVSVYPQVRFANEDATGKVYPDLVDLDNDGLSTANEVEACLAERTKYHSGDIEYCSQPILSDSDGDDVLDSFEYLYQGPGKGNYHSRFSHILGDYKENGFGPYDGNKDINSNQELDKYDN